jgi:hypothetical protein
MSRVELFISLSQYSTIIAFLQVLMISEEAEFPYMRPPLSKELWYNTEISTQLTFNQWNGTQRR